MTIPLPAGEQHPATVHQLKTWPSYFQPVWTGEKTFEVRFNDRGYQAGDVLDLREYDTSRPCGCRAAMVHPGVVLGSGSVPLPASVPTRHRGPGACARYTGRSVLARVGYVLSGTPNRGPHQGHDLGGNVVLSLCDPIRDDDTASPSLATGGPVAPGSVAIVGEGGTSTTSGGGITVTHHVSASPQAVADAAERARRARGEQR
jgi:hypothetical protein